MTVTCAGQLVSFSLLPNFDSHWFMFGETLNKLEFETLKNLNKLSEKTFKFKSLTLTNASIILTLPVTSNFCYLSFCQLSTDRITSKSWHLLFWFYGQKYNKRKVEFMKFQTSNVRTFCFSLPFNFRLSPNPHYQKFFWLNFFWKNVLKNAFKVELSTLTNDFSQNNLTRHMKLLLLKFLQIIYWHANF